VKKLGLIIFLCGCITVIVGGAQAGTWYNMSFYTDMQFGNGDSHVAIQNSNDKWDFYNWISYTDGGNNTRTFEVRYHDDGLKPTGYYPIPTGDATYEDNNMGTDVDDTLTYYALWYVPIYIYAGGTNQMTYDGINESSEAVWSYVSGDWKLVSKITGFDAQYTITSDKFVSTSDWDATKKGDVDRLWGNDDYYLDTGKTYPFFSYDLANDGNANGIFDTGDTNVATENIVLASSWVWIGSGSPGTPPIMPYANIESDQIAAVPIPSAVLLLASGLFGLIGLRRFRNRG